jgi:hypothetical protein
MIIAGFRTFVKGVKGLISLGRGLNAWKWPAAQKNISSDGAEI